MFLIQFSLMLFSTLGYEALAENETAELIFRFFPQGQLESLSVLTAPDKPLLTVISAVVSSAVMLILTIVYFRKHDMK